MEWFILWTVKKKTKKYSRFLIPVAAAFGGLVVVAAIARAVTHDRFRNTMDPDDMVEQDHKSLAGLIWFELKSLFDFNRFT